MSKSNPNDEILDSIQKIYEILLKCKNEKNNKSLLKWSDLIKPSIIGQPVWSIEKKEWFLVMDSALDDRSWIDLIDACGKTHRLIEHDLQKYKLYKEEINE